MLEKRYFSLLILVLSLSACAYNIEGQDNGQIIEASPSKLDIALEASDLLDQDAMVLGISCSAHKYQMRMKNDLTSSLTAIDKDKTLGNTTKPDIRVVASSANSTLKCVMETSVSGKCQSTVDLNGKIVTKSGKSKTFSISKKAIEKSSACGGAVKALKKASYDAVADLLSIVETYDK